MNSLPGSLISHYSVREIAARLSKEHRPVVVYGARTVGEISIHALRMTGVDNIVLVDSDQTLRGLSVQDMIVNGPDILSGLSRDAAVFIAAANHRAIVDGLSAKGYTSFYSCKPLLDTYGDGILARVSLEASLAVSRYNFMSAMEANPGGCYLPSLDVVITERCTLRCKDCANLMQYYQRPVHADKSVVLRSIRRILKAADGVFEMRIIGGEPLVVPWFHEVVEDILSVNDSTLVVLYTNGTIVPPDDILRKISGPRVVFRIANYGERSPKLHALRNALERTSSNFSIFEPGYWQDCATICHHSRSANELRELFTNCCVATVWTLLHGELYHCPFDAHATNLHAIPRIESEVLNVLSEQDSLETLRDKIHYFCRRREWIPACRYCSGRNFGEGNVPPAIQAKKPLSFQKAY